LNEAPPLFSVIFNSPWGDEALKESVKELIGVKPLIVVPWGTKVIAVVKKGSKYRKVKEVEVIEEGEERGLLVGLGDERGNEVLGEVIKIDYLNKTMKVRTCFEGRPKYVSFGRVKLSEDYSDKVCKKPF
jgi:polynucleotide 5'-hydroxyl-kinase GRC3/NOL9